MMFEFRRGLPNMRPRRGTKPDADAELTRDKWLDDGTLPDAGKAPIEQRFRALGANPHASVLWEGGELRLMVPFER